MSSNTNAAKYTVGKDNNCNFHTIQEALDACEENAVINVMPGVYEELLKITKPVKLVGCKDNIFEKSFEELPVIIMNDEETLELDIPVELEGLVFNKASKGFEEYNTKIDVKSDLIIRNCIIQTSSVYIKGNSSPCVVNCTINVNQFTVMEESSPRVENCKFHEYEYCDGDAAITILDKSKSIFTNCEINFTPFDYCLDDDDLCVQESFVIQIKDNSESTFIDCNIHDNYLIMSAISVNDAAKAVFKNCIIDNSDNSTGIEINDEANPVFTNCEISNAHTGISTSGKSAAVFENCSIHDNSYVAEEDISEDYYERDEEAEDNGSAIAIVGSSQPIFRNCKIFNNYLSGIIIKERALATIENCQIYENEHSGIKVFWYALGVITNCEIFKNGAYGISLDGYRGANVFIAGCNIHDNSRSGLLTSGEGASPSVFKTEVNDNGIPEDEYNVCIDEDYGSIYDLYLKDPSTLVDEGGTIILIGHEKEDDFLNYDNYGIQPNAKESILIPKTVKKLRNFALTGCVGLEKIEVEEGNEYYAAKDGVLYSKDFTKLIACPFELQGEFTVPDSVKIIESYAFAGCQKLTKINLPVGLENIGYNAFMYCTSLTSVEIPNTITEIESETFEGCTSLNSIEIHDSITTIGVYAFHGCSKLSSVTLPDDCEIEEIEDRTAFDNTTEVIGGRSSSDDEDDEDDD